MNTLTKEEVLLFHKLMNSLLFFTNQKVGLINANTIKEFLNRDLTETMPLREKIFSDKYNIIDDYFKENPDNFNQEELRIIVSWKKYKAGDFFVVKHLKDYSLFYNSKTQKVYGVKGIFDSFEEKFNGYAPVAVKIILIPFKSDLIYEGIFFPYNISFGGNMRSSLKQEYEESIQKFGIITSLDVNPIVKQQDDEEMLRFYMKSFANKQRYQNEINQLKTKSKDLEAIYYQEQAKDYARGAKRWLKEENVKGYFAVLRFTIIASGETEKELKVNSQKIVPKEKINWIYKFKL